MKPLKEVKNLRNIEIRGNNDNSRNSGDGGENKTLHTKQFTFMNSEDFKRASKQNDNRERIKGNEGDLDYSSEVEEKRKGEKEGRKKEDEYQNVFEFTHEPAESSIADLGRSFRR